MWMPKFRYPATTGTFLTLTYPLKRWHYMAPILVGGRRESAAGIVAVHRIARRYPFTLNIRLHESEIGAFLDMIAYMQDNPNTEVTFWPQASVSATSFGILLVSPVDEDGTLALEEAAYSVEHDVGIVLRRADGQKWTTRFYPDL